MNRRNFLKALAITPFVAGVLANVRKPKEADIYFNGVLQRPGRDYNLNRDRIDWKHRNIRNGDAVTVVQVNAPPSHRIQGLTWKQSSKRFPLWAQEHDAFFHETEMRAYVYNRGRWHALTSSMEG